MRKRPLALLFCLLTWVTGCGGSDSPSLESPPAGSGSSSTSLTVTNRPAEIQLQGVVVDFGAAALNQETTVVLSALGNPPGQPANPLFHATGSYLSVDFGSSKVSGSITFTFPSSAENAQVDVWANGIFVPLQNRVRTSDGRVSGTLTFTPGRFQVGLVESTYVTAPRHQAWGSWNGYVFRPAPKTGTGTFEQVVVQGQVRSPLPMLGLHPLIIVHGLGSSIRGKTFDALGQYLFAQEAATAILGFEYDSLDTVQSNGTFLRQAFGLFGASAPSAPNWNIVAHSMGTLVTRSAIEQPGPASLLGPSSRAILLCGPQLGSGVIDHLQGRNLMGDLLSILSTQGYMDFTNEDGTPCAVANHEAGLDDLRTDSPYLVTLNTNAANNHPQTAYYTLAGGLRRTLLQTCAEIFGLNFDDGVVNISSANFAGLGQRRSGTLPADHLSVNLPRSAKDPEGDAEIAFPRVLDFLTGP